MVGDSVPANQHGVGGRFPFQALLAALRLLVSLLVIACCCAPSESHLSPASRQALSCLAALLWCVKIPQVQEKEAKGDCCRHSMTFVLLAAAICIRMFCTSLLPFENQSGYEEIQTASIAETMTRQFGAPIEFRFTNLLAWLGLEAFGLSLNALRLPFLVMGCLSLVFLALFLDEIKAGPGVSAFVLLAAAGSPWLVTAGHTADEIFAPLLLVALFPLAVNRVLSGNERIMSWWGVMGMMSGILMYEYAGYKLLVCIPLMLFVWMIVKRPKGLASALVSYSFPLLIIVVDLLMEIENIGSGSSFFDSLNRHMGDSFDIQECLSNIWAYAAALVGHPAGRFILLAPADIGAVQPYQGVLFVIAFFWGLLVSRQAIYRVLAIQVSLFVILGGVLAHNVWVPRMSGALLLLFFLLGGWLVETTRCLQNICASKGVLQSSVMNAILGLCFGGVLTLSNALILRSFAFDYQMKANYAADKMGFSEFLYQLSEHGKSLLILFKERNGEGADEIPNCNLENDLFWRLRSKHLNLECTRDYDRWRKRLVDDEFDCVGIAAPAGSLEETAIIDFIRKVKHRGFSHFRVQYMDAADRLNAVGICRSETAPKSNISDVDIIFEDRSSPSLAAAPLQARP